MLTLSFLHQKKSVTRNFLTTYFIMKPLLENTFPIKCLIMSSAARNKHKFGTNQRYQTCCLDSQYYISRWFKKKKTTKQQTKTKTETKKRQHYKLTKKFWWAPEFVTMSCHRNGQKRPVPSSSCRAGYKQCSVPVQFSELLQSKGGLGIQSAISRQDKMTEGKGSCCHVESELNCGIW